MGPQSQQSNGASSVMNVPSPTKCVSHVTVAERLMNRTVKLTGGEMFTVPGVCGSAGHLMITGLNPIGLHSFYMTKLHVVSSH